MTSPNSDEALAKPDTLLKATKRGFDVWPIACASPYKRPPADAYDKMLTLTVGKPGDSTKVFQVYRGVLCYYSEYFNTMLNSKFKEGDSDELILESIDVDVFQMFYNFMNTGNVSVGEIVDQDEENWLLVIDAYIFAEYHIAPVFKNKVVELYCASIISAWRIPVNLIAHLYDGTSEGSPIRKVLVTMYTRFSSSKGSKKDALPKDFLWDCLRAYEKGESSRDIPKGEFIAKILSIFCEQYHDHSMIEARPAITQTDETTTALKQDSGTAVGLSTMQDNEQSAE